MQQLPLLCISEAIIASFLLSWPSTYQAWNKEVDHHGMMPCNKKFKDRGVLLARLLLQEVSQRMLIIICSSTKHCNAIECPVVRLWLARVDNMTACYLSVCCVSAVFGY